MKAAPWQLSTVAHSSDRLGDILMEVGPGIGAALAAGRADKARFDIRTP
jgi:hypothetical protein